MADPNARLPGQIAPPILRPPGVGGPPQIPTRPGPTAVPVPARGPPIGLPAGIPVIAVNPLRTSGGGAQPPPRPAVVPVPIGDQGSPRNPGGPPPIPAQSVPRPAAAPPAKPRAALAPGERPVYVPSIPAKVKVDTTGVPAITISRPPAPAQSEGSIKVNGPTSNALSNAIASAPDGAKLIINPGQYYENLSINKSLTFVANGKVSIHSDGSAEAINTSGASVTFDGISIHSTKSHTRAAVAVGSGYAVFNNCKIHARGVSVILLKPDTHVLCIRTLLKAGNCPAITLPTGSTAICEGCAFQRSQGATLKGTAVATFTQCTFQDCAKGAVVTSDRAQISVDSSSLVRAPLTIAGSSPSSVIGTAFSKDGGSSIVCAAQSQTYILSSTLESAGIDIRDQASVTLSSNTFQGASLVVWGDSRAISARDSFTGTSEAAVAVWDRGNLQVSDLTISDLTGAGAIVYDSGRLQVDRGTLTKVGGCGLIAHSGGGLFATDVTVSESAQCGVLLSDPGEGSLTRVTVRNCGQAGAELRSAGSVSVSELKAVGNSKVGIVIAEGTVNLDKIEVEGNAYSGIHVSGRGGRASINGLKASGNKKGGVVVTGGGTASGSGWKLNANQWTAVFVEEGAFVEVEGAEFGENEYGVTAAGEARVKKGKFGRQAKAAVQLTGVGVFEGCEFSNEKLGILVGGRGEITLTDSVCVNNDVHLEAGDGARVDARTSQFSQSRGNYGVHVAGARASFDRCTFAKNRVIGIFSEGETNVTQSTFTGSGRVAMAFDKNASGEVRESQFEDNGDCAFQCIGGAPSIIGNTIQGQKQFGVYIFTNAVPVVEQNVFGKNGLANVWHE